MFPQRDDLTTKRIFPGQSLDLALCAAERGGLDVVGVSCAEQGWLRRGLDARCRGLLALAQWNGDLPPEAADPAAETAGAPAIPASFSGGLSGYRRTRAAGRAAACSEQLRRAGLSRPACVALAGGGTMALDSHRFRAA